MPKPVLKRPGSLSPSRGHIRFSDTLNVKHFPIESAPSDVREAVMSAEHLRAGALVATGATGATGAVAADPWGPFDVEEDAPAPHVSDLLSDVDEVLSNDELDGGARGRPALRGRTLSRRSKVSQPRASSSRPKAGQSRASSNRPKAGQPRARKRSPTREDTVARILSGLGIHEGHARVAAAPSSDEHVVTAADNEHIVVELYDRDRSRGRMRAVGRTTPRPSLRGDDLRTLARYSVDKLNGSNFFVLWRVMKDEVCTVRLGSGAYGSVFRVCKDDGCNSCVAVKFGIAMNDDGTVTLDAHTDKPPTMPMDEWVEAIRRESMELGPTLNYDGVSWDEVRNTQSITRAMVDTHVTPHLMKYLHHFTVNGGLFLFIEFIPPFITTPVRISSLDDLTDPERGGPMLDAMSASDFKGIVFQATYTIAGLQATFRDGRHNDTKPDNWSYTQWDGKDHTYGIRVPTNVGTGTGSCSVLDSMLCGAADKADTQFVAWKLPRQMGMVKLLDFGIVHSSVPALFTQDIADAFNVSRVGYNFINFGTVPTPCALYDMHLLFNLMLRGMRKIIPRPECFDEFEDFVHSCIPPEYFAAPFANEQYRLSIDAQKRINKDVESGRARGPIGMLMHPYFDEFRMPGASPSSTEFKFMASDTSV
jgi:serine/threonine protein kinase